jgi:hypothetical protein
MMRKNPLHEAVVRSLPVALVAPLSQRVAVGPRPVAVEPSRPPAVGPSLPVVLAVADR